MKRSDQQWAFPSCVTLGSHQTVLPNMITYAKDIVTVEHGVSVRCLLSSESKWDKAVNKDSGYKPDASLVKASFHKSRFPCFYTMVHREG